MACSICDIPGINCEKLILLVRARIILKDARRNVDLIEKNLSKFEHQDPSEEIKIEDMKQDYLKAVDHWSFMAKNYSTMLTEATPDNISRNKLNKLVHKFIYVYSSNDIRTD